MSEIITSPSTRPIILSSPESYSRVLSCNGVFFEETVHQEAFRMPRHSHDEAHMAFLRNGSIQNFKGNRTNVASTSTLMFMPPGETHSTNYSDQVHAFYIQFTPSWWERLSKIKPLLAEPCDYENSPPAQLALRIYQEFQKSDDLTPLMLEGLTLELLVAISRHEKESRDTTIPLWARHAQEYLHAHFRQVISLDAMANAVGVHPGHLMRGFRRYYHCTIGDYVRQLRIQNACTLLKDSQLPLSTIAVTLGFSDQSHFSKSFKQATGKTPTEWQNSFSDVRSIQNLRL